MMRVLFIVGWILLPGLAIGQDAEPVRTIPSDGHEIFCHVLHNGKAKPATTLRAVFDDPAQSVIIILGNPAKLANRDVLPADQQLADFRNRGGSLLIATDYPFASRWLGIGISGDPVRQQKRAAYHEFKDCPFIPFALEAHDGFKRDHPIFQFLSKGLATNCPSRVNPIGLRDSYEILLDFPTTVIGRTNSYIVGSSKDAEPNGRTLFIAGHGIFMNGMMLQPDNDNFAFAMNVVRWLRESEDGTKRPNVLLMVDGAIVPDFDMKLSPPLPPMPFPTVQWLNQLLDGIQKEQIPQHIVDELLGEQRDRVIGIALAVLTIGLLMYGVRKMSAGRESLDFGRGTTILAITATVDGVPIARQRHQAILRGWEFGDEARLLALSWFHEVFGVAPDTWNENVNAQLKVETGFWTQRSQRQADWVVRLAREKKNHAMGRGDFNQFLQALEDLSNADQAGQVALLVDGKNVRQT